MGRHWWKSRSSRYIITYTVSSYFYDTIVTLQHPCSVLWIKKKKKLKCYTFLFWHVKHIPVSVSAILLSNFDYWKQLLILKTHFRHHKKTTRQKTFHFFPVIYFIIVNYGMNAHLTSPLSFILSESVKWRLRDRESLSTLIENDCCRSWNQWTKKVSALLWAEDIWFDGAICRFN